MDDYTIIKTVKASSIKEALDKEASGDIVQVHREVREKKEEEDKPLQVGFKT